MTETSLPWQGEETGDHGPYDSADWRGAWQRLFGGGISDYAAIIPESGPQGEVPLRVVPTSPASRSVEVQIGSALIRGAYYENTSAREIELNQNNTSNPRIDLIAFRLHTNDQRARIIKKQGATAPNPVAPSLTQSGSIYEIPLAEVRCNASFTSIAASNITPLGIYLPGGSVQMTLFENNSGSAIEPGRLVQQDTGNNRSVELAESVDDAIGVSLGRIENGTYGVVATAGVVLVYFSGSVTRGRFITLSSTDGVANDTSSDIGTTLGRTLESESGAGYYPGLLFKQLIPSSPIGTGVMVTITGDDDFVEIDATPPSNCRVISISIRENPNERRLWVDFPLLDYSVWNALVAVAPGTEVENAYPDTEREYRMNRAGSNAFYAIGKSTNGKLLFANNYNSSPDRLVYRWLT